MDDTDEVEVTEVEVLEGGSSLVAIERAQVDSQVATAKQYPRSVDKALKEALTLATIDEETAASMFYALPRGGKRIEGPSARLAEIMAYTWGNLRVDADIVGEDETHVTAVAICHDLEKNVAIRVRVKRRITNRAGKRYDADMIGVTSNAAISIALRNAVFKVIPASLVNRIYLEARTASLGKGGTITQKRQNAFGWYDKLGVTEDQLFRLLGVRGSDDVGEEELIVLRGLRNSITNGETTVEATFNPPTETVETEALNEALAASTKPKAKKPSKKPTDGEVVQLQSLVTRCVEAKLLEKDERAKANELIDTEDGKGVRELSTDLSRRLLMAMEG